jgi:predicted amidophosphoribosyltransferase
MRAIVTRAAQNRCDPRATCDTFRATIESAMLDQLVALAVPPRCAACRAPGRRAGDVLCGACRRALPWLTHEPCCPRCALPLPHATTVCPARDAPFDAAWSAVAYEGAARDAMHALKFSAARPLADVMAAQIAANAPTALLPSVVVPAGSQRGAVAPAGPPGGAVAAAGSQRGAAAPAGPPGGAVRLAPQPGGAMRLAPPSAGWASLFVEPPVADVALVAVPPHPRRRRTRGFDPADLLARALARRTHLPLARALRRSAAPSRQLGADRATRRTAARLQFEARTTAPREAILVDDVHTTGATLAACAHALKEAGAERVIALTWARTL